jgi:hypothetical protein
MTAGIIASTHHNETFAAWALMYDDNIAIKHAEVVALLFGATRNGKPFPSCISPDDKLVSGVNEFGANTNIIGKSTQDLMDTFILKDLHVISRDPDTLLENTGILAEFQKHIRKIEPFADEFSEAMQEHHASDHELTEEKLCTFMENCGSGV